MESAAQRLLISTSKKTSPLRLSPFLLPAVLAAPLCVERGFMQSECSSSRVCEHNHKVQMRVAASLRLNHEAALSHSVKIMRGLECLAASGRPSKKEKKTTKSPSKEDQRHLILNQFSACTAPVMALQSDLPTFISAPVTPWMSTVAANLPMPCAWRKQVSGSSSPELCCHHISLAVLQCWTWGPEGPKPKWAVDTCKHTHLIEKKAYSEEQTATCCPQTPLAGRKQAVVDQVSQSSHPLSWIWTRLKAEQRQIACFRSHFLSPAPGLRTQVLAS